MRRELRPRNVSLHYFRSFRLASSLRTLNLKEQEPCLVFLRRPARYGGSRSGALIPSFTAISDPRGLGGCSYICGRPLALVLRTRLIRHFSLRGHSMVSRRSPLVLLLWPVWVRVLCFRCFPRWRYGGVPERVWAMSNKPFDHHRVVHLQKPIEEELMIVLQTLEF